METSPTWVANIDDNRHCCNAKVYVPLYIIVMSSWVTFWLVKTDKGQETPARTQLGATTVLAVVTIGFGGKAKPQV